MAGALRPRIQQRRLGDFDRGRVVVMDHHEPFVWHMVKMVVEMSPMLDLSNQGGPPR